MSLQITIEHLGTKKLFGGMKTKIDGDIHAALTESADWNAEYWDLHQDKLTSTKEKIKREYADSTHGIAVTAHWAGDEPTNEIEESIDGLLERFEKGMIGTRDRYTLTKKDNQSMEEQPIQPPRD